MKKSNNLWNLYLKTWKIHTHAHENKKNKQNFKIMRMDKKNV